MESESHSSESSLMEKVEIGGEGMYDPAACKREILEDGWALGNT